MSKFRTIGEFQDAIDRAFGWRLREAAYIKSQASSSTSVAQAALIRAGVPLLYAHWEGFVKQASEIYLGYVATQKIPYRDLASCFVVFGAKKYVLSLADSKSAAANIEVVEFFRTNEVAPTILNLSKAVDTESNLSSTVFQNIATSVGVSLGPYTSFANLIDKTLLERRNKIAHGEFLELDIDAFNSLSDEVIGLLRLYKNDIENLASTKAYLRPVIAAAVQPAIA